jgi:hypothetical protein
MVECLPSNHEALNSNSNITQKENKENSITNLFYEEWKNKGYDKNM